jgi:hypothetical protein
MLAIVAAIAFGLALLIDVGNVHLGANLSATTLLLLGLLLVSLHLAGVGTSARARSWRR